MNVAAIAILTINGEGGVIDSLPLFFLLFCRHLKCALSQAICSYVEHDHWRRSSQGGLASVRNSLLREDRPTPEHRAHQRAAPLTTQCLEPLGRHQRGQARWLSS